MKQTKNISVTSLPLNYLGGYILFCTLLVAIQILWSISNLGDIRTLNTFIPICLVISSLFVIWKIIRFDPFAIWNPLIWFFLACCVYYGLGQLIHIFGTVDSVRRVNTLYFVDQSGLARTNLLNTVGVLVTTFTYFLIVSFLKSIKKHSANLEKDMEVERYGIKEARFSIILFLSIGLPIKYIYQLPYDLGLINWVLPGAVKYLGTFTGLSIIPLYWLNKKRGGIYRPMLIALICAELIIGFIGLAKLHVIMILIFFVLAKQLYKPSFKSLVFSGLFIALFYALVLSPFVNFTRVHLQKVTATSIGSVVQSSEAFKKRGWSVKDGAFPKAQLWWTRLAYSSSTLFAMHQYDKGHPGSTFALAPYVFIPRFIYPEKPIMTSGLDFTYLIMRSKQTRSLTGLGIYGEGYWNMGWLGVFITGVVAGVLFAIYAIVCGLVVSKYNFLYLPIAIAGITMGFRIDDWFIPAYLGTSIQLFVIYSFIRFIIRPMFKLRM